MINICLISVLVCTTCSTAIQEYNYMPLSMAAVLAQVSWLDEANVFGHFTFSPQYNIRTVFPGEYKYQSRLSICNVYYP